MRNEAIGDLRPYNDAYDDERESLIDGFLQMDDNSFHACGEHLAELAEETGDDIELDAWNIARIYRGGRQITEH